MSHDYILSETESMPLFDSTLGSDSDSAVTAAKPETEQKRQLRRVTGKLSGAIVAFFETLEDGQPFHGPDLTKFVESQIAASVPDSASRVMRNLRSTGQINYALVDRGNSLYRKLPVA